MVGGNLTVSGIKPYKNCLYVECTAIIFFIQKLCSYLFDPTRYFFNIILLYGTREILLFLELLVLCPAHPCGTYELLCIFTVLLLCHLR